MVIIQFSRFKRTASLTTPLEYHDLRSVGNIRDTLTTGTRHKKRERETFGFYSLLVVFYDCVFT
jgi:hypothetical protein